MDTYIGTIVAWAPNFVPQSWAACQGQTLPVSSNQALFALLGTTYGGNGISTFQLPNLIGRVPIGVGTAPSPVVPTVILGQVGGTQSITLTTSQIPAHTHVATVTPGTISSVTISASNADATTHQPSAAANSLAAPYDQTNINPIAGFNNSAPNTPLNVGGSATITAGTVTNSVVGSGTPVPILPPYLGLNYIICTQGIFPPRN